MVTLAEASPWTIEKKDLRMLTKGVYTDEKIIYVDAQEFFAEHGMPDRPEVRAETVAEIRKKVGQVGVVFMEKD